MRQDDSRDMGHDGSGDRAAVGFVVCAGVDQCDDFADRLGLTVNAVGDVGRGGVGYEEPLEPVAYEADADEREIVALLCNYDGTVAGLSFGDDVDSVGEDACCVFERAETPVARDGDEVSGFGGGAEFAVGGEDLGDGTQEVDGFVPALGDDEFGEGGIIVSEVEVSQGTGGSGRGGGCA